jgi:hypothetical protein
MPEGRGIRAGDLMNREQTIERLRLWAARAQREALYADNHDNMLNWQAQSQVLSGVANFLSDQGANLDDFAIWKRVVADREESLAQWMALKGGAQASYLAGQVAGYDVALTALRDAAGRVWPRVEPHVN